MCEYGTHVPPDQKFRSSSTKRGTGFETKKMSASARRPCYENRGSPRPRTTSGASTFHRRAIHGEVACEIANRFVSGPRPIGETFFQVVGRNGLIVESDAHRNDYARAFVQWNAVCEIVGARCAGLSVVVRSFSASPCGLVNSASGPSVRQPSAKNDCSSAGDPIRRSWL